MINSGKYSKDFIIQMPSHTTQEYKVEFAKLMLDDGSFTDEQQFIQILNAVRENKVPFAKELCFNKEINFSKDQIFPVLWGLTDTNKELAWKLCVNKNRPIPDDKIPLALKCYINKETAHDLFISKFKMFLNLNFPDDFIVSIFGTSGSIARFTPNFCKVLQVLQEKGANAKKC